MRCSKETLISQHWFEFSRPIFRVEKKNPQLFTSLPSDMILNRNMEIKDTDYISKNTL